MTVSTPSPTSHRKSASATPLPAQAITAEVLLEKYAKDGERTADDARRRVAGALASVEAPERQMHWTQKFLQAQLDGFIPAGRIASAAGTTLGATLINCFVQPVGDSISQPDEDHPGIYTALSEAAETMRRGGGVGYDFSRIRPRGAWVQATRSNASGPISYMRVFDRSCQAPSQLQQRSSRAPDAAQQSWRTTTKQGSTPPPNRRWPADRHLRRGSKHMRECPR